VPDDRLTAKYFCETTVNQEILMIPVFWQEEVNLQLQSFYSKLIL